MKDMIRDELQNFKSSVRHAIAPTAMVTLIFFMNWKFFGAENIMIGTFETLSFLRFRTMRNHYACMVKNFGIFLVMAPIAALAGINLPMCIAVNALALFWIAYFLIDEFHPDNYFPAGMALILFQANPVTTLASLANRMAAVTAAFVLVTVIVFVFSKFIKREDPLPGYIRQGFKNCEKQMALCEDFKSAGDDPASDEELRVLRSRLIEVNKKISDEIYASNRAGIRPEGRTNWYCRFVLFFQVMNYLTLHCREGENLIDAGALYRDFLYQFEHVTPDSDYHRLSFRLHGPDIRSFRLRFALRQIITVTPCIIFVRASNLPNVVWLVISVFFMMIPFTDHTMKRVRQRVYGTTGGVIISLLLYTVFTGFPARVIIMTIANFMIYGSGGYGFTTAYITCSALALQAIDGAVGTVLLQRLGYTLIGAVIAMAANRFIFPIRSRRQIDYLADRLGVLREKMRSDTPQDESDEGHRESRVDQMIIQSYLLTKGIEGMYRTLPENERDFDYGEFEREQMHFMEEYLSVHFLKRYNK